MKIAFFVYLALFLMMTTACQKTSGEAGANNAIYQQTDGYTAYTNSNNPFYYSGNSAYLCNCPVGYVPTYNGYAGLGCVRTNFYGGSYGGVFGFLYLGWGNNQWYLQEQLNNYSYSGYNNCYNGAIQSCVVGQNSCPAGSACRQNSNDSNLGLCVTAYR